MANYTEKNYDPSKNGWWKGVNNELPNYGYPTGYYYADTIRSVMTAFGNFFNDMYVVRRNKFQEPVKVIKVPLKYGPREKSHDFRTELESGETAYISLPNMTYKMDSISYGADRDTGMYETRAFYNDMLVQAGIEYNLADQFWSDIQPSPCNINITLEINCEFIDELNQLVEQIMPRFRPSQFLSVKEFWWFNKRRSIKVTMNDPGIQIDNDSMGEEDKRIIKGTINFTIECVQYLPIKNAQIIQKINTFLETNNKNNIIWHNQIFGNSDGSLTTPYDMSKIYGTKVTNSYVLDGIPETTYNEELSAYTTLYNYKQTDELMTYDSDAKLLTKVVHRWSPEDNPIYTTEELYDEENYRYYTSSVPHINEWVITKEYMSLSGYGSNSDITIKFGSKTLFKENDDAYSAYFSTYVEEDTKDNMKYSFDTKTHKLSYSGKYDSQ